jgi:glycosyltransferase involved in cell wall biosynthesis
VRHLQVGILHYTAPPIVGGVEAVIGQHARLLVGAGHRVRLITGGGGRTKPGIEVAHLPAADTRDPRARELRASLDVGVVPTGFGRTVDDLADELERAASGLDLVVAHNVCSLHFNLALTAALRATLIRRSIPPLVAWHHDLAVTSARWAPDLHPGPPWDLIRSPWPGVVHVAISDARQGEVAGAFGVPRESIRVIPNGIEIAAALGLHAATRRLVTPLRLAGAGIILLAPSRLVRRKNLELAIQVLAELRRDGDDARLVVTAATDPHDLDAARYREELHALAESLDTAGAVHFLTVDAADRLPDEVVLDLYRLADVLLLTSRDEGFGLPILEAGATRLPVVCADLPSLRALAGDGATYFGPDAAPIDVARLVRDRLVLETTARLAARIRAQYSWASIFANEIEPLFLEVAGSGAAAGGPGPGTRPGGAGPVRQRWD